MKPILFIMSIFSLSLLLGCQNNGQSPATALSATKDTVQGPSDGGGGDTCNGRLIESYRVDITTLPEYQDIVRPILLRLSEKKEGKETASPFMMTPTSKSWYFVDCKLQDIPKERKGLFLETYQMAIHTNREIYVDAAAYGSMAIEEKAKLLIHEMTMSYYLMRYLPLEEILKMSGIAEGGVKTISNSKMFRPLPYRPLNQEDHERIRNVAAWLWDQRTTLTSDSFQKQIILNDFDKRFSSVNTTPGEKAMVDPKAFVRMFKRYQWGKLFPHFCKFEDETNLSKSDCSVSMESELKDLSNADYKLRQLYFKIRIVRAADQKVLEQEFSYPLQNDDTKIGLYKTRIGTWLKTAPFAMTANMPKQNIEGARSQMALFMLNVEDVENPEIYQILFQTKVWYSFEDEINVIGGVRYKHTYGYSVLLNEESENVYLENELPFAFNFTTK
ncbi:MAG: hypothetical protein H7326_00460, partial [Bdellovibrionaceae bacterium]|nr:hypothetical protein [Pseudobdellovibrionaceae bacterium]